MTIRTRSLNICHQDTRNDKVETESNRARRLFTKSSTVLSIAAVLTVLGPASESRANPQGGTVVGGQATIAATTPNQTTINQSTDRAIINWLSFGVGNGEHTRFVQPSSSSMILNRVTGGTRSDILGQLSANGIVWVVNPQGVFFGPNAQVDVAGLLATTHDIKNEDFMARRFMFKSDNQPSGIIENQGRITVADAGLAAFVAPGVVNHGVITARLGEVSLTSGNAFTVDFYGDQKINLAMDSKVAGYVLGNDGKSLPALVHNDGQIFADGGLVQLTAIAARGVVDTVVNNGGVIQARSVEQKNGEIILSGGQQGSVKNAGILDASGKEQGETGGRVVVVGEKVQIQNTARVDVSGDSGGGVIVIGGDYMGGASFPF